MSVGHNHLVHVRGDVVDARGHSFRGLASGSQGLDKSRILHHGAGDGQHMAARRQRCTWLPLSGERWSC